jgi:sugar/nucleoside kinase (ribokinase family)
MPKILVVGDVIDDILVIPNGEIRLDTDTNSKIQQQPGGSAANFACWIARLGIETHFVGRVGKEDQGRHSEILRTNKVIPHLQVDPELQTGRIVVLVQGQQRSFLTDRGANKNLDLKSIPDELFGDALYLSGYTVFDQSVQDMQQLIKRAKARGLVACDPGSAGYIADHSVHTFLASIAGVDLLLPSLEEGRILSAESRPEIVAALLGEWFPQVALTLGEDGVQLHSQAGAEHIAAIAADLVDATGAGDAFAASLIAETLKGKNFSQAAQAAVKFAAKAVTKLGGRP